MDLYAENILDHYRHPRAKKLLPSPTVRREEVNASCGDTLTLDLEIMDGRVVSVGWTGEGCAISQAAMSMLAGELKTKTVGEVSRLTLQFIYDLLGVPIGPRRVQCALLCLHALKNALRKSAGQTEQSWAETVGSEIDN